MKSKPIVVTFPTETHFQFVWDLVNDFVAVNSKQQVTQLTSEEKQLLEEIQRAFANHLKGF